MEGYNPARGDVTIRLDGGEHVLRPSFGAIMQMEDHFQRSIFDIARDFAAGKLTRAGDLPVFIRAGMKGAGEDVPDALEDKMMQAGLVSFLNPVGQFLSHACGIES